MGGVRQIEGFDYDALLASFPVHLFTDEHGEACGSGRTWWEKE
jgi:hypothetical protein